MQYISSARLIISLVRLLKISRTSFTRAQTLSDANYFLLFFAFFWKLENTRTQGISRLWQRYPNNRQLGAQDGDLCQKNRFGKSFVCEIKSESYVLGIEYILAYEAIYRIPKRLLKNLRLGVVLPMFSECFISSILTLVFIQQPWPAQEHLI